MKILPLEIFYIYFSPYTSHAVEIDGMVYPTVEHAYQCQRYTDKKIINEIIEATSPVKAWEVSTKYKHLQIPEFKKEQYKLKIMKKLMKLKAKQHEEVKKALIDYGTSIGILAAQCVSEPMTQFVLNSKHRTGGQGGTKTNEIVRIQEILGAKDTDIMKNPQMLIMVKPEYENDRIKVQEIANHIEMIKFERFANNIGIFFEEYGNPIHPTYMNETAIIREIEKHNIGQKRPTDLAKWCIRFGIDKEELLLKSMKLETIITAIYKAHPELFIIYSPENSKNIFIRCYIRNSMVNQAYDYYDDIVLPLMEKIKNVIVRGISGLISTSVMDVIRNIKQPDGSIERKKVYGVFAVGTNLIEVLGNPYIDPYRTQSDSIIEIEKTFGLMAARSKIINELTNVMKSLNPVWSSIFADEMCYQSQVSSIQRTGLQTRENSNITLRLSFQTALAVITNASVFGNVDKLQGISSALVMGSTPQYGTLYNKISVNEDFIKDNVKQLQNVLDEL